VKGGPNGPPFLLGVIMSNQKVSVVVKAISLGYYKGKIIQVGESFKYEGLLKEGKLPLWVEAPKDFKAPKLEAKLEPKLEAKLEPKLEDKIVLI